jgi:two-component system response regulator
MVPITIQARFGTAVRSRRKHLGISQEELAGRAGLHRTYVAYVERGARNLSLASIEKLAQGLEISIQSLFAQTGNTANHKPEGVGDILLAVRDPDDAARTLEALEAARVTNPVHVVGDGTEALEFLFCTGRYARRESSRRPQLILLDLDLPRSGGLEVLRRIRDAKPTRAIPVVVLARSQRQPGLAESLRLGAEAYLLKPVDFSRFASIVPRLKLAWALLPLAMVALT